MAKYGPLARFLDEVPAEQLVVTLSFTSVARLVDGLTPSAYRLRQWWAIDSKMEARAPRFAGWHVDADGVTSTLRPCALPGKGSAALHGAERQRHFIDANKRELLLAHGCRFERLSRSRGTSMSTGPTSVTDHPVGECP